MDISSRLKRVTDLFVEGTAVYLGDEGPDKPVVVWVNKLNSYEVEEARRDGSAHKGLRMAELAKEGNPERAGIMAEIALWSDERLVNEFVQQKAEEIYLDTYNDLQTDPEQRERSDRLARLPALLDEAGAPADDSRRLQLNEDGRAWMQALSDLQEKNTQAAFKEARESDRKDLEAAFLERWRERETLDVFMQERRTTQMFFALRECKALDVGTETGRQVWDHSICDHSIRLLQSRAEVRKLPDVAMTKFIDAIDGITVSDRDAGNSDAPVSSSAPSEPSRPAEEASTPSTPVAASPEPLTS